MIEESYSELINNKLNNMLVVYKHKRFSSNCILQSSISTNEQVLVMLLKEGTLELVRYQDLKMVGIVNNSIELREYI